MPIC